MAEPARDARSLADRLRLVVVTDAAAAGKRGIVAAVRAALAGGTPAIQLRAKELSGREMVEVAHELRQLTQAAGALLFVNDRVDVALAAGADGAHVGDDDVPIHALRDRVPSAFIFGRSVATPDEAARADADGADYLGVGPIFATPSKLDAGAAIGLPGLRAVASTTNLPCVAIGGVAAEHARAVAAAGASGIAVIRAVLAAPDPERAAAELLAAMLL